MEYFQKVTEIDPENIDALFNIAVLHINNEKLDEAIEYLFKVIEIDPDYIKAWERLSITYMQKSDASIAKAYAAYSEALTKLEYGDEQEAKKLIQSALKLKPDFPQAKAKLDELQ